MGKPVLFVIVMFASVIAKTVDKEILANGVSEKEQKEIVDIHNKYRLWVMTGKVPHQPIATNIKELCWDEDLAKEAQRLADKMKFKHEDVKNDRWPSVGQNLVRKSSMLNTTGADWSWAITRWFSEVNSYTFGNTSISGTGHYTQIVWAETTHVGCGYTNYFNPIKTQKYWKFYVCNYGPGGNLPEEAPYKTGRCGCKGLCKTICKPRSQTKTKGIK